MAKPLTPLEVEEQNWRDWQRTLKHPHPELARMRYMAFLSTQPEDFEPERVEMTPRDIRRAEWFNGHIMALPKAMRRVYGHMLRDPIAKPVSNWERSLYSQACARLNMVIFREPLWD